MEDIKTLRAMALSDDFDDSEEWDEETILDWEEKMNEPIGYTIVNDSKSGSAGNSDIKASA